MPTAQAFIDAARSMEHGWEYVLGGHGRLDATTGKYETDCQYMVDRCCQLVGIADRLGPELPWEVAYMWSHTTFPKVGASATPEPGWIIVLGLPGNPNYRLRLAHTGIVTMPGHMISALLSPNGVYETAINVIHEPATGQVMQVIGYLDTGLEQPNTGTPPPPTEQPPTAPLPPSSAPTYTVRPGDNLTRIARAHGTTVRTLVQLNQHKYPSLATNPGFIRVGWVLVVP